MINWIHSRFYRPERGWDPVPASHVAEYAESQWEQGIRAEILDALDEWSGGLRGKSVLDLGGGPGHYSVEFARRGANVTWFDISARYRNVVLQRAAAAGVRLQTEIGYMDEAPGILNQQFDVVFNRICWNYCRGDRGFSSVIWSLTSPGGIAYVDTNFDAFHYETMSQSHRIRIWLNRRFWIKIGHPFPPRGRLVAVFSRFPMRRMLVDNTLPFNDRLTFQKKAAGQQ